MKEGGWISLYRSIQNHWIWEDPVKLKWWLDILLLANHKDNKVLIRNKLEVIKRGYHHTSEVKLSKRWGVSRTTVRRFLELLESDKMIEVKKGENGTTLKVINYEGFQPISENKKTAKYTADEQPSIQLTNSKVDTNNKENNDNKENKCVCLGEFKNVTMKEDEYTKLISTHTKVITDKYIEKLSLHMKSTGKGYKSNYATVKKWIKEDEDKKVIELQRDEYGYDTAKIRRQLLGIDKQN